MFGFLKVCSKSYGLNWIDTLGHKKKPFKEKKYFRAFKNVDAILNLWKIPYRVKNTWKPKFTRFWCKLHVLHFAHLKNISFCFTYIFPYFSSQCFFLCPNKSIPGYNHVNLWNLVKYCKPCVHTKKYHLQNP